MGILDDLPPGGLFSGGGNSVRLAIETGAERVLGAAGRRSVTVRFAGDPSAPASGEVGSERDRSALGLRHLIDELNRDDNPDLRAPRRYMIFDQMWMSDPMVRALLWYWKLPIRAGQWTVEPASNDGVDQLAADLLRWQLGLDGEEGHLLGGWQRNLGESMLRFNYGSMTHEIVWDDIMEWRAAETELLIRPIFKLGPRFPHMTEEYVEPRGLDRNPLGGLKQWGTRQVIPGEKLIHRVLEQEGSRYTGVSLVRPAYGYWKIKRAVLVSSAIGYDRWASGVPVVWYPSSGDDQDKQRAYQIGRDLRSNERSAVAMRGPRGDDGKGWDIDLLDTGKGLVDPVPFLRHMDDQTALAGLAQWSRLGTTGTGSRAVGDTIAEPYFVALNAAAEQEADDWRWQFGRPFVTTNLGAEVKVPRIRVSQVASKALEVLAAALHDLSAAGMNFSDLAVQNRLREIADLPPLEEGQETGEGGDRLPVLTEEDVTALRTLLAHTTE